MTIKIWQVWSTVLIYVGMTIIMSAYGLIDRSVDDVISTSVTGILIAINIHVLAYLDRKLG